MQPPKLTIVYGLVLVAIGLVGYRASGGVSVTALIPTYFGVTCVLLGWFAHREPLRKPMMHLVAFVTLLAVVGSARGIPGLIAWLGGGDVERPAAAIAQSAMALVSLVFFSILFRSFLSARRSR